MAPSVVDAVRTPLPPAAAAPAPKPSQRFDDVLAGRRERVKPQPKADDAPAKKVEAKMPAEPKPDKEVDEPAEPEAGDAEASDETEKADIDKPVKKAAGKPKSNDGESDADAETDVETTYETDAAAEPVMTLLPVEATATDEASAKVDAVETPDVEAKTGVPGEAAALAVQLTAVTPTAPVQTNVATEAAAPAEPVTAPIDATAAKPLTLEQLAAQVDAPEAAAITEAGKAEPKRQPPNAADADARATNVAADVLPDVAKAVAKPVVAEKEIAADGLQALVGQDKPAAPVHAASLPAVTSPAAVASPRDSAEANVDRIVTSIRGEILRDGGTMQIRLDPPTLGSINVQISVDDGVMSASLQTSNDEATRLLSHNLAQLKNSLEAAGVTVDRIQVKQAAPAEASNPSQQQTGDGDRQQQSSSAQDQSARQEQQRREMLQRMWAKLSGNGDPLDLVA